ncbi:MAG TPA: cyclase family protein [Candidatus Binatia bacterium]|jgi:kynurenine formamidase
MRLIELTMPLRHQSMPDEVLPTAVQFFLAPKDHQEKGIVIGSETGTCLVLPSAFAEFRTTARIDQLAPENLMLRPVTVVTLRKGPKQEIRVEDMQAVLDSVQPARADAVLIRTGWGDFPYDGGGDGYLLDSPHFSLEGARYLAARMQENANDLLLLDTAIVGRPGKHLIPEWCAMIPRPAAESGEARMYLHLYGNDKMKADFAVEMEFARRGIMTVRKLVHCGGISRRRVKVIVSPLQIVRGVSSTCRVVVLEDAP